mmetsp:Transcript_55657/g.143398  ORF Transcript_55657/g.143398 Transcript_55657/m.143398 type:complete len:266 (+) Transcript_55657:634-1431(+)
MRREPAGEPGGHHRQRSRRAAFAASTAGAREGADGTVGAHHLRGCELLSWEARRSMPSNRSQGLCLRALIHLDHLEANLLTGLEEPRRRERPLREEDVLPIQSDQRLACDETPALLGVVGLDRPDHAAVGRRALAAAAAVATGAVATGAGHGHGVAATWPAEASDHGSPGSACVARAVGAAHDTDVASLDTLVALLDREGDLVTRADVAAGQLVLEDEDILAIHLLRLGALDEAPALRRIVGLDLAAELRHGCPADVPGPGRAPL